MCGICGIINFNGSPVTESGLKSMMGIMKHRGPDDEGIFIENNAGLGFVRLSILDLSPAGHQPMISSNNRYVLVFNGEIFNYIELREELVRKGFVFQSNTDSEVLLNSYILWGEDCLHRFNGMWAFVIYDRQERKLFGSRDRYGIKPFYYHFDASAFLFASEIPPITSHFAKKPLQNDQAIFDYLLFNRTDQDATTFYKDVLKLQHGCKFTLELPPETIAADYQVNNHQPGKLKISKWYTLIENLKEPFKGPDEFRESLSASIGLRLRSDVPVGICFSGGLDSSTIISLLLKDYLKDDINTFSTAYGKGLLGDETEYINEYREVLKNMYFTYPNASTLENDIPRLIRAHNEPIPSTSPYAQFKVMELAKEHVVVTLDGQGADELLAGYEYFYGYYYKELLRK
jgi:asparagine synthase (glutamine-hydrolysing)